MKNGTIILLGALCIYCIGFLFGYQAGRVPVRYQMIGHQQ